MMKSFRKKNGQPSSTGLNNPSAYAPGIFFYCNQTGYSSTGNVVYNNTVVDCRTAIRAHNASCTAFDVTVKNNAFIEYQGTGYLVNTYGTVSVTVDYNFWTSNPEGTIFDGAHDVINADPDLTKESGWLTLASTETGSSFAPQVGSPLVDRVAGIASYTTLPLSGSTWPSAVTTGNAALEIKPNTPTLTSPCNGAEVTTMPTLVACAYAATSATPVDFGAIQLNMSGTQTHGFWQICSDRGLGNNGAML